MTGLSCRAMAKALGLQKTQVADLFKAGMPRSSVEAARAWRLERLELSRTAESRIDRPAQTTAPHSLAMSAPAASGEPDIPDEQEAVDANTLAYRQDRARNERIKADRAELELKQLQRELVSVRDVEQLQFTAGRIVRDRIEMVPARAAADLHARVLELMPEQHRAAVAAGLELHTFERHLSDVLRQALAEAAQAIEQAQRDDEDGPDG